ncbi:MAG: hypothetical protein M1319_03060 [Chloroflexi bacterium]|nr:hypothetical protein [Chloroflexota bacterium]
MAELAALMSVMAMLSCAVLYSQMRKRLKDMEQRLLLSSQGDLADGLREEVEQLVSEIQAASQAAAQTLNQQVSALRELSESAAIQIEALSSAYYSVPKTKVITQSNIAEPPRGEKNAALAGGKANVITLAGQGRNTTEIAREVGMSRGEIDLLLQFYRHSGQSIQR